MVLNSIEATEKELQNQIVGAILSGQRKILLNTTRGEIEVTWKPFKGGLTSKARELEANRIAKLNVDAIFS